MKTLVLALSLLSTPMFAGYSRYDHYDNVELFLEDCRLEDEEQYERMNLVLRLLDELDKRERDMVYAYLFMVVENEKILSQDCDCCVDDIIEEVWSGCENCS